MRSIPLLSVAICMVLGNSVFAQTTIYRIENPGGGVTFSDRLPMQPEQGKVVSTGIGAQSTLLGTSLPFELRQAVSKFPVVLYTASDCSPCDAARALLVSRGIPFSERTVSTTEDNDQLKRISGESVLPFLTVGTQRVKGFSSSEWMQYLDAAGYPSESVLPKGYKNPPASPLVPPVVAVKPKAQPKESPAVATPANQNPDGFVF